MAASRELLRDAIAIWRDTRDDAIADAVDRLTAAMMRSWRAPDAYTDHTFQAAWLEAAADDVTRGWAATNLLARTRDVFVIGTRLQALIAAGPDPRVGRAMIAQLGGMKEPCAREPTLAWLVGDVLSASTARDWLHEALTGETAAFVDPALAQPPPQGRTPTPRELAYLAFTPNHEIEELERAVHADPDDDGIREVLADALQADGDPRGELIVLQRAGELTDAQRFRIGELVRDHGRGWLGPLAELARAAWFERGFVSGLELRAWTGGEARWQQLVDDPALGMIEELAQGSLEGPRYAQLLTSPALRVLRRIEVAETAAIEALELTNAPLVHIACPAVDHGAYVPRLAKDVLPRCARFDTLRSFACRLDGVAAVLGSPIGARLTHLSVAGELAAALAFWRALRKPLELELVEQATLASHTRTGSIRMRRDGAQTIARVTGSWGVRIALASWSELRVDRLELAPDPTTGPLQDLARGRLVTIPPERSRFAIVELGSV